MKLILLRIKIIGHKKIFLNSKFNIFI